MRNYILSRYGITLHFREGMRTPAKNSGSQITANMSPLKQSINRSVPSTSKTCEPEERLQGKTSYH